jgi:polyisoprenoid-binding protein YceI
MTQQITTTGLVAGTWSIDASHSEVGFSVRHLMSKVKGRFTEFTGTITTRSENPLDSAVEVMITSSSITTGNEQRDGHLKSADFFDPTNGGTLTFESKSISETADGYVISGELTINGITKPVDLAADFLGVAVDAYGATRLGAEAHTPSTARTSGSPSTSRWTAAGCSSATRSTSPWPFRLSRPDLLAALATGE